MESKAGEIRATMFNKTESNYAKDVAHYLNCGGEWTCRTITVSKDLPLGREVAGAVLHAITSPLYASLSPPPKSEGILGVT